MSINTTEKQATDFNVEMPDANGHFGIFGGRFVSETLTAALDELQETYEKLRNDPDFQAEFDKELAHYVGRPSPLYFAERLTEGKKKVIAETGAGQHGVASATVAARFGLECKVFMGSTDVERQKLNVNTEGRHE